MFELEGEAEAEHRNIGQQLDKFGFDNVLLCGQLMKFANEEYPAATLFENKALLAEELRKHPVDGSVILVKASRGMGLESLVDLL